MLKSKSRTFGHPVGTLPTSDTISIFSRWTALTIFWLPVGTLQTSSPFCQGGLRSHFLTSCRNSSDKMSIFLKVDCPHDFWTSSQLFQLSVHFLKVGQTKSATIFKSRNQQVAQEKSQSKIEKQVQDLWTPWRSSSVKISVFSIQFVLVTSLTSCRNSSDKSAIFAIRLQSVLVTSLTSCRNPADKSATFAIWVQSVLVTSLTSCWNSSDKSAIFAIRLHSQFFDSSSCTHVLAGEHCFSLFSWLLWHPVFLRRVKWRVPQFSNLVTSTWLSRTAHPRLKKKPVQKMHQENKLKQELIEIHPKHAS